MPDVCIRLTRTASLDVQRVGLETIGELLHRLRKGRGDEMALPLFGKLLEDRVEFLAKAHVEHLVRLVEDHVLDRSTAQ